MSSLSGTSDGRERAISCCIRQTPGVPAKVCSGRWLCLLLCNAKLYIVAEACTPSPSPSLRSEFSLKFSATATQQPPPPSLSPQPWCEPNRIDPRPSPPCHRIGGAICSRMLASGKGKMKVNMVFHVAINFSSVGCKWDVSYFICPNAIQLLIATQVPAL